MAGNRVVISNRHWITPLDASSRPATPPQKPVRPCPARYPCFALPYSIASTTGPPQGGGYGLIYKALHRHGLRPITSQGGNAYPLPLAETPCFIGFYGLTGQHLHRGRVPWPPLPVAYTTLTRDWVFRHVNQPSIPVLKGHPLWTFIPYS